MNVDMYVNPECRIVLLAVESPQCMSLDISLKDFEINTEYEEME